MQNIKKDSPVDGQLSFEIGHTAVVSLDERQKSQQV
jgi:hypothetical protein